jgi:hypothetical protein
MTDKAWANPEDPAAGVVSSAPTLEWVTGKEHDGRACDLCRFHILEGDRLLEGRTVFTISDNDWTTAFHLCAVCVRRVGAFA